MKTRVLTLFNKESNFMVDVMTDLVNVRENQRSNKELTIYRHTGNIGCTRHMANKR